MHLLLMALLSTVTLNEVTLDTDIIENIDGQWVAPGYRVAEEIIIDPIDYGTPLLNPANESRNVIGFQPFFVDTPDGEKWRLVLAYEGEVVVLQEDTEPRRFQIEKSSTYMLNSPNGRYVLLGLQEEEQTQEGMILYGVTPPERKVVLLDVETGNQVSTTGLRGSLLIANDGCMVGINNDSLRFYDSNFNLLNSTINNIRQTSHTPTAYASDGSLFTRQYKDSPSDSLSTLRAYDRYGNVVWDSYPPNTGWPTVSENGNYVFLLSWGRMLCLDGGSGALLWEEPHDNEGAGLLMTSSSRGAAYAFGTDVTPSEARVDPFRERVMNVGVIWQDSNPAITRVTFQSDNIALYGPNVLNSTGCSLWRFYLGQRPNVDLSTCILSFFSTDGLLLYSQLYTKADRRYVNISGQRAFAISSDGNIMIWYDDKEIHIVSLVEEGVSE